MAINTAIHVPRERPNDTLALAVGGYRVVHIAYGVVVFRPISLGDIEALAKHWHEEYGYDLFDTGVASALGATYVATNKAGSTKLREMVETQAREKAAGDAELEWALGWDTGTSSMTILLVLGSSDEARRLVQQKTDRREPPQDPDDLGRCIRLLDRFPAWRDRLATVASCLPAWAPYVIAWADLERLYREECPEHTGSAPKTYAAMQKLREEASP
jgi:hypothetical protein